MALCEGTPPLGSRGHQRPVGQHGRNQKESLICPGSELKSSLGFSEPHGHILQMGKLRPREIKCYVQKQSWGMDSMTPKCSSTRWKYINIKIYIYMWFVDHFVIFTSIASMVLVTALRGKEGKHCLSSLDKGRNKSRACGTFIPTQASKRKRLSPWASGSWVDVFPTVLPCPSDK